MDLNHPWAFLLTMGAMIPIYLMVIPFLVGLVSERVARVGVLIATVWSTIAAIYIFQWVWETHHVGRWAAYSAVLLFLTPIPLIIASIKILRQNVLDGKLVYFGALLLHIGMFLGMGGGHMPG